jgi:Ca2+/H+ antiporter
MQLLATRAELIIAIIAMKQGLFAVVKASAHRLHHRQHIARVGASCVAGGLK